MLRYNEQSNYREFMDLPVCDEAKKILFSILFNSKNLVEKSRLLLKHQRYARLIFCALCAYDELGKYYFALNKFLHKSLNDFDVKNLTKLSHQSKYKIAHNGFAWVKSYLGKLNKAGVLENANKMKSYMESLEGIYKDKDHKRLNDIIKRLSVDKIS